jgi:hypothetical protein
MKGLVIWEVLTPAGTQEAIRRNVLKTGRLRGASKRLIINASWVRFWQGGRGNRCNRRNLRLVCPGSFARKGAADLVGRAFSSVFFADGGLLHSHDFR